MIRSVVTEVRRALARRLVRVVVLVALAGIVLAAAIAFANSSPDEVDAFSLDDIWTSDADGEYVLGGTASLFLFLALLVGASLVGAEYKAGTVTTLLTWEPRRLRVIGSKLVAAGLVAGGLFVVLQLLLVLALAFVVGVRGAGLENVPDDYYRGLAGFLGRGALIMAWCAVLAAGIATLGRNTTAAFGAVVAYVVVVESILRVLRPGWEAWYLPENVFTALEGRRLEEVARSAPGSALVLLGYLAVVVTGAVVVFARRDVT
ncbi:MAG TPA: hypothetical protein VF152_16105 [Acidimicrobiia bacterium]